MYMYFKDQPKYYKTVYWFKYSELFLSTASGNYNYVDLYQCKINHDLEIIRMCVCMCVCVCV